MKKYIINFTILILLFFVSCSKCGENVYLGDFYLMPQSKGDWFPFTGVEELTFNNATGDAITLKLVENEDKMAHQSIQQICSDGWSDTSEEYFKGEWLLSEYKGVFKNITYSILVILYVEKNIYQWESIKFNLYDRISYQSIVDNENDKEIGVGGRIDLIANNRGNSLDINDLQLFIPSDFSEEMVINGITYQDVWYFDREGTPSLYVQQGQGIIAFLGFEGEVWVAH